MAENTVTMEIIDSEQYKRANIRFNGKPSEEIREELKKEGWFYSRNHNVWYPKNDAAANSRDFAQHIRDTYFPEQKEEIKIITEATEKDELQAMIQNGSSLKDILSKLSDMYGDNAVHEAFNEVRQHIDSAEEKPEVEAEKSETQKIEDESPEAPEMPTTEGNLYPDDVNVAKTKLGDIVRETFLTLSDEEKENGTTTEQKNTRYEKWYLPMIDEIMDSVIKGDQDVIRKINEFDLDKANHAEGNKYYSQDEAFRRDVNYKLLPELYEAVQDKIRKEYDKKKIPYIVMFSSESPVFPTENKVYTVKEFNELLLKADSEFHNRREFAEKKYGSADNYWDLENEGKLPEEDRGIQFGYDKTNFKFFNIPNPNNPEDTFSYEPSRYDIGDGNGSIFDYVRSTCSHDEFIEALNQLEKELYFPEVTKTQREDIDKIVAKEAKKLTKNLKDKLEAVDNAQEEYKELHKKWLIESSEAEAVDKQLEDALSGVKATYDKSMSDAFSKILNEYPYASIKSIEDSQLLQYAANEVKKMAVNELYLPSRNAQKAMNAEDYASYNSTDWAKLRKIWGKFPANVNMDSYARELLNKTIEQRNEKANAKPAEEVHDEKKPSTELTDEDLELCKKVIPPSQYRFTLELTKGEEGDFYKGKLKEIAETYRKINTDNELINEDGTHNVGFRYFLGNTEIYLSEIDSDGIGFGYSILNGDLQMSEWGSTTLEEILNIPYIEMDYHVDKDATIEEMLYKGHPEYFKEYAPKNEAEKPYNFFINDAANLDLGIGAEIEPITGLTAEEAAVKYAELKEKGLSPYIGINIPGDFVFDDKEGQGAGIFTETNGHPSFYMGDNFVKELKKNDEHAQNVLAAYKELYEMTDKYLIGVEKPEFLFAKLEEFNQMGVAEPTFNIGGHTYTQKQIEEELRENIQNIFEELSPKPRIDGIRLYQNPEKNNKINILVQYDTEPGEDKWREDSLFNVIAEENILFNGMEVDVNPITPEKSGTIEEYLEHLERLGATSEAEAIEKQAELLDEHEPPLTVYTFSPFGYEGSLVTVETDLRRGIPAYDIVGIADSTVKESRERIRAAFKNSGLELPAERILQSLSPADLRKDSPMDVAMAVDILARKEDWRGEPVLALGELELSGNIRPTRGAHAAVTTARAAGISNIICDKTTAELLKDIHGIKILAVENLKEISEKINDKANFIETKPEVKKENEIEFNEDYFDAAKESLANYDLKGHFDSIRAIEIAVAGKHNILQVGAPGCGKTLLQQNLIPALTPKLTEDEALSISRINSIAGLDSPNRDKLLAPFRMPHQTASIEGICGGGPNCRPGEISLAHKGTLFLDEAAEFRSSVLQMLRVPLETKSITLSRAGRTTVYPADFQLAMATNPCPCGCYGSKDKICLDSAKSIDLYWKKFSAPLIDRIEIKNFVQRDEKDERTISLEEMREQVRKAYEIQRKRGVYNSHLTPEQIDEYCKLSEPCEKYVNGIEDLSPRSRANLLKLSLTIANMDGREEILMNDLLEARELSAPMFEKPNQFKYQPENTNPVAEVQNADFRIDDETISKSQIDAAIRERKLITEPVLNGEKTGLYKAFKDFEDKGVFDVQGTQVKLSKNGGLTPTGWKQLQAAMEIYRSKKFETFRYIMIDRKTGEIADQLAITSHMPNFCNVTLPNDETLKQVISRAEEKDYLIAVCHNHPSGNTTESSFDRELTDSLDRSLRRNDGLNRFAGHIILDHDTFNLAVPNETPGKCHWKKMEPMNVEKEDRLNAEHSPSFAGQSVSGTGALKEVAEKINDTENWNDNFIPVVFTNADRNITGVQYYSKNFFENESDKIRNEFQFSAMEAGAIGAFPIITDSLWNKLPEEARTSLETKLKEHIMNDAFTDAAFNKSTITEKYSIEAGRNYYSFNRDSSDRKIDVVSTWTPEVNPRLFPEEHKKQNHDIER